MGSTQEWYLAASFYSDIAIFLILSSSIFLMFIKLRLWVDVTGVVTLAIFWFSALSKLISSTQVQAQGYYSGTTAAITIISVQLVWCSLYFFTFEMRIIQSVLENQDIKQHRSQQKKFKLHTYLLMTVTMIFGVVYSIYRILQLDNNIAFTENYELISWCYAGSRTVKFLGDGYLHIVFIMVFKYLLQYRSFVQGQRELRTGEPQTQLSRLIILWVLFLFLINLWNGCNEMITALFQSQLGSEYLNSNEYAFVLVLTRLVFPIKDFLIAMSLIWLYIQQGLKQKRQQQNSRSNETSIFPDQGLLETGSLIFNEESPRMIKSNLNSIMRRKSIDNDEKHLKQQKISSKKISGAPSLDLDSEDMQVEQFSSLSRAQSIFDNQQFRNFIFDNIIPNARESNPVVNSQPFSIPN